MALPCALLYGNESSTFCIIPMITVSSCGFARFAALFPPTCVCDVLRRGAAKNASVTWNRERPGAFFLPHGLFKFSFFW